MAVSLVSFRPIGVRPYAIAIASNQKPHQKMPTSSNWWTPLFDWSSEPDYIEPDYVLRLDQEAQSGSDRGPMTLTRSRFAPGTFTDEKAKRLRLMTTDTAAFHDAMYHSTIASRLASEFSNRSDA